jgi:hypothetical protein
VNEAIGRGAEEENAFRHRAGKYYNAKQELGPYVNLQGLFFTSSPHGKKETRSGSGKKQSTAALKKSREEKRKRKYG